jgi:hypothetical protein
VADVQPHRNAGRAADAHVAGATVDADRHHPGGPGQPHLDLACALAQVQRLQTQVAQVGVQVSHAPAGLDVPGHLLVEGHLPASARPGPQPAALAESRVPHGHGAAVHGHGWDRLVEVGAEQVIHARAADRDVGRSPGELQPSLAAGVERRREVLAGRWGWVVAHSVSSLLVAGGEIRGTPSTCQRCSFRRSRSLVPLWWPAGHDLAEHARRRVHRGFTAVSAPGAPIKLPPGHRRSSHAAQAAARVPRWLSSTNGHRRASLRRGGEWDTRA